MHQSGVTVFGEFTSCICIFIFLHLSYSTGFDFVYRLLQLSPEEWLSLTEAEKHIWFVMAESLTPYIQNACVGGKTFSLSYLLGDDAEL